MHEISLCESLIRIIEKHAKTEGFDRVVSVKLALGDLAGVSREALEFGFPLVAKGTVAEDAKLDIIRKPGRDLKVISLDVNGRDT